MKKDWKSAEFNRPYRLAHQTLAITGFNFETESMVGYVEMLVHPLKSELRKIKVNSKQCSIYRVAINDSWESIFTYNDPALEICQGDAKQRNLDYFESCHFSAMMSVDADCGSGELTIKLPLEALALVQELKPFRVCIEFALERPAGGVRFVVPDMDGTMLDRGAHLFTYGHENAARLWFPCIDTYSEVCTWKLEFTVDMYMTAISCGDLIETVYTPDLRKKTYHYFLSTPTAAPNIALAVGPFEVFVDPHMHEVTHFCLPHLLPLLKQTTTFLHEVFEFYEELLSSRYPYSCYKQVFVDQAYTDCAPYATITFFSTNLLHSKKVIDQVPVSRQLMANAIAQQFFGTFINMNTWYDAWLPRGISGYLASLYKRKAFGNNEYRHYVAEEMQEVQDYESKMGGIVLDPSTNKESNFYFPTKHPYTVSPQYYAIYLKKAHLVLRILELRIGRELLLQVLNKLLSRATNAAQQKFTSHTWINMLVSSDSFVKCISTVTGKDLHTFIEQWVYQGGFARFLGNFVFNRKRNVVELELRQDGNQKGSMKYVGPLTVAIQELDGTFNHTFKIEENKTKFEIVCHSKSRRHKKKKIPLCTGEEVDMDLGDTDSDSPVLWLRIDPDMMLMRHVKFEQPDWMWQYMLRYERCVISQELAIRSLETFPTPKTRLALTDTIENEHCFYKVRIAASYSLAQVANKMVGSWAGPPAMMTIFNKMFGSHSCRTVVKQNLFSNFQHYFMQKEIPLAMAKLRTVHSLCPPDVLHFILELFKYNDNSKNKLHDNYYRAMLIKALSETVTPAVTTVTITGQCPSTDALTEDTKLILEEITRYLNLEKLLPCYKLVVTVSCLQAIRKLQKFGHLPCDATVFKSYAVHGNFLDVRLAALKALVDFAKVESSSEILNWLLGIVEEDPEPFIKHSVLQMLVECPPFLRRDNSSLSTETLVERLWTLMNAKFAHDPRLRCDVIDLYFTLFGRTRPSCLPIPDSLMVLNLKEKRAMMNSSVMPSDIFDEGSRGSGGVKRRAESPLSPRSPFTYNSSSAIGDDGNQLKLKIRFGSKSPDADLMTGISHPMLSPPRKYSPVREQPPENFLSSPSPPPPQPSAFTDHFNQLLAMDMKPESHSVPEASMTITTETVMESSHREPSPPRLSSEDSNSPPPRDIAPDQQGHSPAYHHTEASYSYTGQSSANFMYSGQSQPHMDYTHGSPGSAEYIKRSPSMDLYSQQSPQANEYIKRSPERTDSSVGSPAPVLLRRNSPEPMDYSVEKSLDRSQPLTPESRMEVVTESVKMEEQPVEVGYASAALPHTSSMPQVTSETIAIETSSSTTKHHKHHKEKKKKKKNKHKHKHKHKHDRDDKSQESDVSRRVGMVAAADVGLGVILDHPSSGVSYENSPHIRSRSTSPEFEVI